MALRPSPLFPGPEHSLGPATPAHTGSRTRASQPGPDGLLFDKPLDSVAQYLTYYVKV